jgi:hypothetical protein
MPISPFHLNASFLREVDEFEIIIDSYLTNKTIRSIGEVISVTCPVGITSEHIYILCKRYEDAGWKNVTYRCEPREGEWLEFRS